MTTRSIDSTASVAQLEGTLRFWKENISPVIEGVYRSIYSPYDLLAHEHRMEEYARLAISALRLLEQDRLEHEGDTADVDLEAIVNEEDTVMEDEAGGSAAQKKEVKKRTAIQRKQKKQDKQADSYANAVKALESSLKLGQQVELATLRGSQASGIVPNAQMGDATSLARTLRRERLSILQDDATDKWARLFAAYEDVPMTNDSSTHWVRSVRKKLLDNAPKTPSIRVIFSGMIDERQLRLMYANGEIDAEMFRLCIARYFSLPEDMFELPPEPELLWKRGMEERQMALAEAQFGEQKRANVENEKIAKQKATEQKQIAGSKTAAPAKKKKKASSNNSQETKAASAAAKERKTPKAADSSSSSSSAAAGGTKRKEAPTSTEDSSTPSSAQSASKRART